MGARSRMPATTNMASKSWLNGKVVSSSPHMLPREIRFSTGPRPAMAPKTTPASSQRRLRPSAWTSSGSSPISKICRGVFTGLAASSASAPARPAAHHDHSVRRRTAWMASATKHSSTTSLGSVE
jgi:hypothetical protein